MIERLRNTTPGERWIFAILALSAMALIATHPPQSSTLRPWFWRAAIFAIGGALLGAITGTPTAYILRRVGVLFAAIAIGFTSGLVLNAILTLYTASRFDDSILRAAARLREQRGTVVFVHRGQESIPFRLGKAEQIERVALTKPTPLEVRTLCAAEDERCFDRKVSIDIEAVGRAVKVFVERHFHGRRGHQPGASNLSEQVAGLLLELKPAGPDAFWLKLDKTLGGLRVDDLFSREEQAAIYLSLAPFGSWHGQQILGIAAAARVFYGRDHTELSISQVAELMARLRAPDQLFPYRRWSEDDISFAVRNAALKRRMLGILQISQSKGWLLPSEGQQAGEAYLDGLRSPAEARAELAIPHQSLVIAELKARVPDFDSRNLEVQLALDRELEDALAGAAAVGFERFAPSLPSSSHEGDFVEIDATVLDEPTGTLVAELGMATQPGGCASHCKPELYGFALETHALASMEEPAPGLRISAHTALVKSINAAALGIVRKIGPAAYMRYLESQGYRVEGPYLPIALGAGVLVSPRRMAANYLKFGYSHPGWRVEPGMIARIVDTRSGTVLYEPAMTRVFSPDTAIAVRSAMEDVSRFGTAARALSHFSGLIASKTGTAGFHHRGKVWQGDGGSWCVSIDSNSQLIVAVRVRWRSNRPFEIEGGRSAAFIVSEFIDQARKTHITGKKIDAQTVKGL